MSLKASRVKAGLTAGDAAKSLGVSVQAVYQWEAGSMVPRTQRLVQLAELYGCSVDDLLRKED